MHEQPHERQVFLARFRSPWLWLEGSSMQFADKVLKCSVCSTDFVFTAGEQLFFSDMGFTHDPMRCKGCMAKRGGARSRARTETRTKCSACGSDTTVPFKPTQGKPVLCRPCFKTGLGPISSVGAKP